MVQIPSGQRYKRTYDSIDWDFPCGNILAPTETIIQIVEFVCDEDAGLVFGAGSVTIVETGPYSDGSTGAIGQVGQVQISGGTIPPTADDLDIGVPNLLCTLRMRFKTSLSPNQLEATVSLLLIDDLVQGA